MFERKKQSNFYASSALHFRTKKIKWKEIKCIRPDLNIQAQTSTRRKQKWSIRHFHLVIYSAY